MNDVNGTNKKHQVLITGASTGIGFATALHLDQLGFKVYAGVRKEKDGEKLARKASSNLTPLVLDVCKKGTIDKCFEIIAKQLGDATISLVNNAGLSLNGPLELLPHSDIKKILDVNVYGLLAVTKTFLPLIRESKGRLVNISSGHGLLAIPDKSVYAASKFAVCAISDSLRLELRPFGVFVSNVVVGKINTNVLGKIESDRIEMLKNANHEILYKYRKLIDYFDKAIKHIPGIDAIEVAEIIGKALTHKKPEARYLIGPGAKKMKLLAAFPGKMRDNLL